MLVWPTIEQKSWVAPTNWYDRPVNMSGETAVAAVGEQPSWLLKQISLHAQRLAFRHPTDGRELRFEAPLPPDLVALLARLRRR